MFAADNPFLPQARLATRLLRFFDEEPALALKGGTAINLFYRDLPRLSVDLDFTYLLVEEREASFAEIEAALRRVARRASDGLRGVRISTQNTARGKLVAQQGRAIVTGEVNTILRGSVYPAARRTALSSVEEQFGDIEAQVLSFEDVYAGKLVAALDRQHPRDLFDVMKLLEGEGVSDGLLDAFVVYLASHDRPIAEVLNPREKDIRAVYEREFAEMTEEPVTLDALLEARAELVTALKRGLLERHRDFLRSVKRIEPDWALLPVAHIRDLPGIQWKLHNLGKLKREQPARHAAALAELERVLERFVA